MLLPDWKYHLPRHLPPHLVSCAVWEARVKDLNLIPLRSFLLIIPAISQLVLNKSDLVLVNASVMQPRPESVQLTLKSALDLKIALPVRIEPITLDLFVRDIGVQDPWANITIPGLTIKGNTTLGIQDVHTPLTNVSTWTSYVHDVVFQKETALSLKGSTNSYLGVLKSYVTMDKDIVSPSKFPLCNCARVQLLTKEQPSIPSKVSPSQTPLCCCLPAQMAPT